MAELTSTTARQQAAEPETHGTHQRRLSRAMVVLLIGYVGAILALMVFRGAYMSPDLFVVFAAVIAVVLGRTRLFLRDWLPFVAIFLAWESMRGLADNLGMTVHSDDVVAVERFLFFGRIPSVELQHLFHTQGTVGAVDLVTTSIYIAHFALPLTVGLLFWIFERPMYFRYVMTLMLMTFTAFVFFLLLPVAPPRFAGAFGQSLPVVDIARVDLRAAPLRAGDDLALREHQRQPGGGLPVHPLRLSAAGLLLRARAVAACRLADARLLSRGVVQRGVPGPPLRGGRTWGHHAGGRRLRDISHRNGVAIGDTPDATP